MQATNIHDNNDSGSHNPGEDEWLVSSRCEKARSVYTLLSCLRNVGSNWGRTSESRDLSMTQKSRRGTSSSSSAASRAIQPVTVFCYPNSMTFHVIGKSRQIQASVNMQAGLFSQYNILQHATQGDEDEKTEDWHSEGEFCVNLTSVLECLSVLGVQSLERMKLTLSYNLSQEMFKVELTDDAGVLLTAGISGMQPPEDDTGESLALAMRSSPVAARIIIRSDTLREILVEVESVGGAKVGTVSLNSKSLDIAVVGDLSECLVSIPCRGDHVVSLDCPSSSSAAYNFPLHSLLGSLRGLEIAEETCITINKNGMMAIQHQVVDATTGDGAPSFVDFIMCCLNDEFETTDDPGHSASQSQDTAGSYSESLARDDQSLAESRAACRADRSRVESPVGSRTGSRAESRAQLSSAHGRESDSDKSDSEDDTSGPAVASSVGPLFGSVVRSVGPQATDISRRSTRRRVQSPELRRAPRNQVGFDSDRSHDLLANSSEDEEEELQELDVSTRRNANTNTDRGNTSSPELVYGRRDGRA